MKTINLKRFMWRLNGIAKRAFDIIMSLVGLIFLAPFFVFIAILIKRDTPGQIFYWGPRLGRKGKIFNICKFRTMYDRPESYSGPRLTRSGDPRITPVGKWLRDSKINELPQLWNVLKGEMSIVGPRPEDPDLGKDWPEEARNVILSIRPGITSPASVLYHDEEKLLTRSGNDYYVSILPNKIRLDQLYVHHHSIFGDLDTIFWTLAIILPQMSRTKIPEGYLFAGPIYRAINRYATWFVIDLFSSLLVIAATAVIWRTQMPLNWGIKNIIVLGFIIAFLYSGFNSIVGLNRIVWDYATADNALFLIVSGTLVTFVIVVLNYLLRMYQLMTLPSLPTTLILVMGMGAQVMFVFARFRMRLVTMVANRWLTLRRNTLAIGERVLIVGNGENSQIVTWLLGRKKFRTAFSIVGMVDDRNDLTKHGMQVNGTWMLGGLNEIPALVKRYDVGVLISTLSPGDRENNEIVFDFCQANNIRLIFLNDLLMMVDRQATQPIENFEYPIWLDERLEYKAMHNSITGLPNRFLFQDRLKSSLAYSKRYNSRMAILFVHLGGLKNIYDKIGRKYGNQVLVEASRRLGKCGRESDTLAQILENEFVLILENIIDNNVTDLVTSRINAAFAEPFEVERREYQLTAEVRTFVETEGYEKLAALCKTELEMLFTRQSRYTYEMAE
jgi:diguanylate cyclase (GGDEF)-like protein